MGCNESKPAVATNNTISRRPFRKKSSIKAKDVDSIAENNPHVVTKHPSPVHEVEEAKDKPNNDEVKDISVNIDAKDAQVDDQTRVKGTSVVVEPGKSISSPDHYFSSGKDEDATESVATEDGYFSPNKESVKDEELKENVELKDEVNENVVHDEPVEEKSLVEQQPASVDDGETKIKEDGKENEPHIVTKKPSPVHDVEVDKFINDEVNDISVTTDSKDAQVDEQNKIEVDSGVSISLLDHNSLSKKYEDVTHLIGTADGYFSPNRDSIKDEGLKEKVELKHPVNEIVQDDQVEGESFLEKEPASVDYGETQISEDDKENNPQIVTKNLSPVHEVKVAKPKNDNVEDINANTETKNAQVYEQNKTEEGGVVVESGKSMSTTDHYFSSRKDEDGIESVGTEVEYFSPNRDYVKDEELKENVELKDVSNENVVQDERLEEKILVEEEAAREDVVEMETKKDEKENNPQIVTKNLSPVHEVKVAKPKNDNVEDINANTETKNAQVYEQNKTEEGGVVVESGKSMSTTDHYFSSRKDEDGIESVGTEVEYFSPNRDYVKDEELKENVELKDVSNENVVQDERLEEKILVEEEAAREDVVEMETKKDEKGNPMEKYEALNDENIIGEEDANVARTSQVSEESSGDTVVGDSVPLKLQN